MFTTTTRNRQHSLLQSLKSLDHTINSVLLKSNPHLIIKQEPWGIQRGLTLKTKTSLSHLKPRSVAILFVSSWQLQQQAQHVVSDCFNTEHGQLGLSTFRFPQRASKSSNSYKTALHLLHKSGRLTELKLKLVFQTHLHNIQDHLCPPEPSSTQLHSISSLICIPIFFLHLLKLLFRSLLLLSAFLLSHLFPIPYFCRQV